MNCSEALIIAIRGLLNTAPRGSEAITTAMEHNSVLRPLNALAEQVGLVPRIIPCDGRTGLVDPDDVRRAITPRTRLIACQHASNVTGTLQPIAEVAAIAREAGVPCLIDAAQSVGHVPMDVQALGADFVAFPGHKGLLGPLGTGVLYVRPGAEEKPADDEGRRHRHDQRAARPADDHARQVRDRLAQRRRPCRPVGGRRLGARQRGIERLREHDRQLCQMFLEATGRRIEHLTVYGPGDLRGRIGVFSVNIAGLAPGDLAAALEADFGILTRAGVHCAPLAHQTIGTHPAGTCRFSFGPFTTAQHVRQATAALARIAERAAVGK